MFQRKKLSIAVASAIGIGAIGTSVPVLAQEAEDADDIKIERGGRRRKKSKRNAGSDLKHAFNKPAQPVERIVRLGETISVSDLSLIHI